MRSPEAYFIGLLSGFLIAMCIVSVKSPAGFGSPTVVRDTIRTACCEEYLDHIALEHVTKR